MKQSLIVRVPQSVLLTRRIKQASWPVSVKNIDVAMYQTRERALI